ncbi:MAG TPA: dihydroxyacetone kinase phosphoryl donor subunit DhaM [Ktedonobacterales bacterium]
MTVGIVIVSHSQRLAEGVVEFVSEMAQGPVAIIAAGGKDTGELGTSLEKISRALEAAESGDGVLVLVDVGSAAMTAQVALEALSADRRARIMLSAAPLVEGAFLAAIRASMGSDLASVTAAASEATEMDKGL